MYESISAFLVASHHSLKRTEYLSPYLWSYLEVLSHKGTVLGDGAFENNCASKRSWFGGLGNRVSTLLRRNFSVSSFYHVRLP